MKNLLAAVAFLVCLASGALAQENRVNLQITITSGTPIRVYASTLKLNRLFIQSRHNNAGLIYVLLGVPPTLACNSSSASQLTAELGPGSSTQPGQSFSDPQGAPGNQISNAEDMSWACIDGTSSGDKVIISGWRSN